MTNKLISQEPGFSMLLERAVQAADEILVECGDDEEFLEKSTATLPCDFILDCFDTLIEYARRYEDFDTEGILGMLELQRDYQIRYGNRTIQ